MGDPRTPSALDSSEAVKVHELKTLRPYFQDIVDFRKCFELRKNDRGFEVGDYLHLREWDVNDGGYTGRSVARRVTYVLKCSATAPFTGLQHDHVVMGLAPAEFLR